MEEDEEEAAEVPTAFLENWLLEETEAETIKAGTPEFYRLACRFIEATAVKAFNAGDNSLLARAGFAEALKVVSDDAYAGSGGLFFPEFHKDAYAEILEEWRDIFGIKKINRFAELWRGNPELARDLFWQTFDTDADGDTDAADFRQVFLTTMRGGKLRTFRKQAARRADLYNEITDDLIFSDMRDTANDDPARVFVDWLNWTFFPAGMSLAQWLKVANIPAYERQLADLRAAIADNFGVFPAPFECATDNCGNAVIRFSGRELETLSFIALSLRTEAKPAKSRKGIQKTLVTIEEAANRLNKSRQTIHNWLTSPNPPKVGIDEYFTRDLLKSPIAFYAWAKRYDEETKREEEAKKPRNAEKAATGRKRNALVVNPNAVEKAARLAATGTAARKPCR